MRCSVSESFTTLIIVAAAIFVALLVFCPDRAYAGDDWQYWRAVFVKDQIGEKVEAKFEKEYRTGDRFYYEHNDIGVTARFSKSFSLGLNFREIVERDQGKESIEHRPHLNGTFKVRWGNVELSDRNRFECRFFQSGENRWRYRNSLKVSFLPKVAANVNIVPVVIDEVFFNLRDGELQRNRLYLGFETRSKRNVDWEALYLLQSTKKDDRWNDQNAIVTRCFVRF